jgi:hypothetical protein
MQSSTTGLINFKHSYPLCNNFTFSDFPTGSLEEVWEDGCSKTFTGDNRMATRVPLLVVTPHGYISKTAILSPNSLLCRTAKIVSTGSKVVLSPSTVHKRTVHKSSGYNRQSRTKGL